MATNYFGPSVSPTYGAERPKQQTTTPFSEFRKAHPEYDGIPDMKLAGALRNKVPAYKAMPIEQFYTQIGLGNLVSPKPDPTKGMSAIDRGLAASGKFFVDQGRGVKQLTGNMSREEVDRVQQLDAPLMDTTAGKVGYAGTALATMILPGATLSRGASAGKAAIQAGNTSNLVRTATTAANAGRAALLPTTLTGVTTQGLALGGMQPVGTQDSRTQNTLLGGGFGAVSKLAPDGLAALIRGAKGQSITQGGINRRMVDIIRENSIKGDDVLMQPNPSLVPGVQRTLAEESLDDGIAGLSRTAIDPAWMTNQGRVNNAARVNYLRPIAGDEVAMRDAEALREANNSSAFEQARAEQFSVPLPPEKPLIVMPKGVERPNIGAPSVADDMSPLYSKIDGIKAKFAGGDSEPVVGSWAKRIQDAKGDSLKLDNIRKSIALTMQQKPEGVNISDLSEVYDALSDHLKSLSPNFSEAIDGWARDSIPIDRMNIGQYLIGRRGGTAVLDPVTGQQVLTPAAFSDLARDLDGVAQTATGFKRASADRYLSPDDFSRISAVQDDLERQAFGQTAGGRPGPATFDRFEMAGKIANTSMPIPQIVKDGFAALDKVGQDRLKSKLAEVLANPQQARELLAKYPPSDARIIEGVLQRLGWAGGVSATAVATSP
jgi:hypothetical protein